MAALKKSKRPKARDSVGINRNSKHDQDQSLMPKAKSSAPKKSIRPKARPKKKK